MSEVGEDKMIDLRLGRWETALAGVTCDALITDPPFGPRVHKGHDAIQNIGERRGLGYRCWYPEHVHAFVQAWAPRTRGWMVAMTSHDLVPAWEQAYAEADRYHFAPLPLVDYFDPVPFIDPGSRVRIRGDGPTCDTVWICVARPRTAEMASWRTLPGHYVREHGDPRSKRMGGKPLGVMRRIVADYSRPGDVVCDPLAGHGTTLKAAALEGRRAFGAERVRGAYVAAMRELFEQGGGS